MEANHVGTSAGRSVRTDQEKSQDQENLQKMSFVPSSAVMKKGFREKLAITSVICGGFALVSWVIIVFGILISTIGIISSLVGLRSRNPSHARIGLCLSIAGLLAAILYAIAAGHGFVPYSYFSSSILQS